MAESRNQEQADILRLGKSAAEAEGNDDRSFAKRRTFDRWQANLGHLGIPLRRLDGFSHVVVAVEVFQRSGEMADGKEACRDRVV